MDSETEPEEYKPVKIDPTHSMRRFSDIPWGCWSCGACDCHHQDMLVLPCNKGIRKVSKDGT